MNKKCLLFFAAVLLAFLVIVPGIAAAEDNAYTNISASTAKEMLKNNEVVVIDVRVEKEFNAAHLNGAVLVPVKKLGATEPYFSEKDFLNEVKKSGIKKDEPILVYCLSGARSTKASEYLVNGGYTVYNMKVGIQEWINEGYPVVSAFVDVSDVNGHLKPTLNAQIDYILSLLEMKDDVGAKEQIDVFKNLVTQMEQIGEIDTDQAKYLKAEAELISKMII